MVPIFQKLAKFVVYPFHQEVRRPQDRKTVVDQSQPAPPQSLPACSRLIKTKALVSVIRRLSASVNRLRTTCDRKGKSIHHQLCPPPIKLLPTSPVKRQPHILDAKPQPRLSCSRYSMMCSGAAL